MSIVLLNQLWFQEELRAQGHRVISAASRSKGADICIARPGTHIEEILAQMPAGFYPDCLIYYDDSGPITVLGLEKCDIPKVFFSVDAHHHSAWHSHFACAFDETLVAQKDYIPEFKKFNNSVTWFPLWAPVSIEPKSEKTCEVSFRGNLCSRAHPKRVQFFKKLRELVDVEIDASEGRYRDIYPASRIVVNQAVKRDVNFRVFEGMMCGAFMLTTNTENGLGELFEIGKELVVYEDGDAEDAANKIRYYLENEVEREKIAAAGRKTIIERHTAKKRGRDLERILLSLEKKQNSCRHYCAAIAYLTSAKMARGRSPRVYELFVKAAAEGLSKSAEVNEVVNDGFINAVHLTNYLLRELGLNLEALNFVCEIYQYSCHDTSLAVSLVASLLEHGLIEQAFALAREISHEPEKLLAEAPKMTDSIHHRLADVLLNSSTNSRQN
ncbi:MAG: glycosyltransferase family 1 protein [Deltaproteobacteria bacterium]|nr:glycosyltransferase family 1 protein [Deltaproteobacteria bacterium]